MIKLVSTARSFAGMALAAEITLPLLAGLALIPRFKVGLMREDLSQGIAWLIGLALALAALASMRRALTAIAEGAGFDAASARHTRNAGVLLAVIAAAPLLADLLRVPAPGDWLSDFVLFVTGGFIVALGLLQREAAALKAENESFV